MVQFLNTDCFDLIDMLLWGLMPFAIGIDIGVALNIRNHKPTKKKRSKTDERFSQGSK